MIPSIDRSPTRASQANAGTVTDLDTRVGATVPLPGPDPELEAIYSQLLERAPEGRTAVLNFLKQYANGDGALLYKTAQGQMGILQKMLASMKSRGEEGRPEYKVLSDTFASAFASNALIQQFMQDVFSPEAQAELEEDSGW
ncbi:hypothetical protein [Pseudomonas typographi]|uniref:DUF5610 domain-containing protein n=1 Tax=Pseudomonas typographi TaxID=2715964 RepID=A0ABR7Z2K5_9PSED|nr:hypothetical protein [Pseudomonas typographi]MBD1552406.1 hypothetical protein [Pseudomonas typographi]MBD1587199.1 hypothetical protein [Pseudomonas typographi]MBD1599511.1 hypothetical protein [Pseudomonas typographi]